MSDPGGHLDIRLTPSASTGGLDCTIVSTRPVAAASAFIGRSPEDTLARLPRLYSICGRAQAGACATAIEQALGETPHASVRERRAAVIATETIREHLWRLLLDWPALLGEPPNRTDMAEVLALSNRLSARLDPCGDLFRIGGGVPPDPLRASDDALVALSDLLTRTVFGRAPARWLGLLGDPSDFAAWCRGTETAAARLCRALLDAGEAALGCTSTPALPPIPDDELIARLNAPDGADFIARPTWDDQPRETSPFTRHPPLGLIEVHGAGLLARLAAQLTEVAVCLRDLTAPDAVGIDTRPIEPSTPGIGLGRAVAARGLLIHLVRIAGGRIRAYRILAPTEWNFHPRGVVAEALEGLSPEPEEALRRQAALLITAIDPCVAFRLRC